MRSGAIVRTEYRIPYMEGVSQAASTMARSYLWSILIWMSFAPVGAAEDKVTWLDRGVNRPYWELLLISEAWLFTAALLTPPIFSVVRRYPIVHKHRAGRMAAYLFGALPYLAVSVCVRWLLLPPWDPVTHQFAPRTLHSLVGTTHQFGFQVWCYLLIVFVAHAYHGFQRAKAQELERAELQQALSASELQMLKSQLQPHYLFNTLHGISTLIDTNQEKAKASILKLSNLLRTSLEYGNSDLICFAGEVKFVESYLELEQMRLEDRLQVSWEVDPETRDVLVPQLILQPLVENAILHGIACCRDGGWIRIVSRKVGERVEIEVRNSVGGKSREGLGLGHRNTAARIKHLYADEGSFIFRVSPDDVAVAILSFPGFQLQQRQSSESLFVRQNGDQTCVL